MSLDPTIDMERGDPLDREDAPDTDVRQLRNAPRQGGDDDLQGIEITTGPGGQGGDVRQEPDRPG
jgi:hypothetical protein